jgi:hypothetical protein
MFLNSLFLNFRNLRSSLNVRDEFRNRINYINYFIYLQISCSGELVFYAKASE